MLYYYIYEYLYYNDHHLAENRELVERQKILINMTVPTVTMERCFHPPSLREKRKRFTEKSDPSYLLFPEVKFIQFAKMLFFSALKIVIITMSSISRKEPGSLWENSTLESGLSWSSLISLFRKKNLEYKMTTYNFNHSTYLHLTILRRKSEVFSSNFMIFFIFIVTDNPSSHAEGSSACKFSSSSPTHVASIRAHPTYLPDFSPP